MRTASLQLSECAKLILRSTDAGHFVHDGPRARSDAGRVGQREIIQSVTIAAMMGGDEELSVLSAEPRKSRLGSVEFELAGETLKDKVEALEKELVKAALVRHRWNQSEAARDLGLSRVGLANKIKRYAIEPTA